MTHPSLSSGHELCQAHIVKPSIQGQVGVGMQQQSRGAAGARAPPPSERVSRHGPPRSRTCCVATSASWNGSGRSRTRTRHPAPRPAPPPLLPPPGAATDPRRTAPTPAAGPLRPPLAPLLRLPQAGLSAPGSPSALAAPPAPREASALQLRALQSRASSTATAGGVRKSSARTAAAAAPAASTASVTSCGRPCKRQARVRDRCPNPTAHAALQRGRQKCMVVCG